MTDPANSTVPPKAARSPSARLDEYQEASTLPLLVASFLYTAALVVSLVQPEPFTRYLLAVTWFAFIVDYLIQLWLAPIKWRFVVRHIPYLIALVFPPLRMYLLIVFSFRLFANKNSSLRDRIGLAAGFAVLVIVVFGALLTLFFEAPAPDANIKTYGEALWWAAVTVTTVGYGDYTPVTAAGRVVGTLVFSTGVAAISILTATVIGVFTDNARFRRKERAQKMQAVSDPLMAKLDEINDRLIRLERTQSAELSGASRKLSASRRTVMSTVQKESSSHRQPQTAKGPDSKPHDPPGEQADSPGSVSEDPEDRGKREADETGD